ncbi:MAG: hypothetical protein Q8M31_00310 [Beijerinckiaceae bacterium]|nr:hypothetical protein [Beijerinckiaceae bacterium]
MMNVRDQHSGDLPKASAGYRENHHHSCGVSICAAVQVDLVSGRHDSANIVIIQDLTSGLCRASVLRSEPFADRCLNLRWQPLSMGSQGEVERCFQVIDQPTYCARCELRQQLGTPVSK